MRPFVCLWGRAKVAGARRVIATAGKEFRVSGRCGTRKFSAAMSSRPMGLPARRYCAVLRLPAFGKFAGVPIVSLNAPIISYHVAIMLLSESNVPVFHVEQSRIADELCDLRLERCDPELGWHLPNQRHEACQVLPIEFGGRIIE